MRGLRTGLLALVTLSMGMGGWPASAASGEVPEEVPQAAVHLDEQAWLTRTARMEGAARNVAETASAVKRTADAIGQAGRLQELARLTGEAEKLQKKVISLRLAAEVLPEPIAP